MFVCRFISLYHPTNLAVAKAEAASNLRSRVDAFLFVLESGLLDNFTLSVTSNEQIVKTMDAGKLM